MEHRRRKKPATSTEAPPRDRRVTAKVVAELAGVSTSAVSRAFTKGASVSTATHGKVMQAARSLGYHPNILARSLTTKRTELIGLVSNNFDNPAFMEIFDLFTRRIQQRGRRPILANLSGGTRVESALDMLRQYSVDGVIVASSTLPRQFIEACMESSLPIVHAFGRAGGKPEVNTVGSDNIQGGRLAGDLLLERGYRKIAFLGGPRTAISTEDRLRGLRASLEAKSMTPTAKIFGHTYSHEAGVSLMRELLRGGGIDAVFCGDDILAMGALDFCRDAGVSVPRDLGIIGFNDMAMAAWSSFNLTTIRQPIGDIIITAVDLVLDLIDRSGRTAESRLFPCETVVRGTLRTVKS